MSEALIIYVYFTGYESNPAFLGSICGRVANRIDGASFTLDGVKYEVSKNDPLGNNMCHGGFKGLSRVCHQIIFSHSHIKSLGEKKHRSVKKNQCFTT